MDKILNSVLKGKKQVVRTSDTNSETSPKYILTFSVLQLIFVFSADAFASGNHNGQRFTTSDNDNDQQSGNCATENNRGGGGWWFSRCEMVCFTFPYANNTKGVTGNGLIQWEYWKGSTYSLKYASMMIRRV